MSFVANQLMIQLREHGAIIQRRGSKTHASLSLPLHFRGDFQVQRLKPEKARGVVLIASFGRVGFRDGDVQANVYAFFFRLVLGFSSGSM
jgi:hypothetical protein